MRDIAKSADLLSRHKRERTASPFDAIDPLASDIEDILKVTRAEGGVVRCTNLGHTEGAWLFRAVGAGNEVKRYIVRYCIAHDEFLSEGGLDGEAGYAAEPRVGETLAKAAVRSRSEEHT